MHVDPGAVRSQRVRHLTEAENVYPNAWLVYIVGDMEIRMAKDAQVSQNLFTTGRSMPKCINGLVTPVGRSSFVLRTRMSI